MPHDPTKVLAQLVRTASVNPMGRSAGGPPFGEQRLTGHLCRFFAELGFSLQRQQAEPGRENLIARLDGRIPPEQGGPLILLDAHQDTVPIEGMTVDPFGAEIRQGRLYGRGACDTKGGMAAMLVAAARLAEIPPSQRPSLALSFTVNEEYGFSGARALTSLWTEGLMPKPDVSIVLEPTGLDVVTAHKGVIRWKCHTTGRAAHSADPEAGENAIYKMGQMLRAIEAYVSDVLPGEAEHPLCGAATLSVGTIHGGVSVNTVPDRCTIEIDSRFPPGQRPAAMRDRLIDYLTQAGLTTEHDSPYMEGPALDDQTNGDLAGELGSAVKEVAGRCTKKAVPYATNASLYCEASVPSVVFGPGQVEQAHTKDEWVSLEQVEQAADILYRFCRARA